MGLVILPEVVFGEDISDGAFRCLAALSVYAREGEGARPKHETLALRCRSSVPSVKRYLGELVKAGLVTVKARKDDSGRQLANEYTLAGRAELHRRGLAGELRSRSSNLNPPIEIFSSSKASEDEAPPTTATTSSPKPTARKSVKSVPATAEDSPVFLEAWKAYPRRAGNSRAAAWVQWRARLREAVQQGRTIADEEALMLGGTTAYAGYIAQRATDPKWNPDWVKHGSTFYGRGRHFDADYGPVEAELPPMYLSDDDEREGIFNPAWSVAAGLAAS